MLKSARAAVARSRVGATVGSRREADAWLAQASAHRERLEARDDPANWDRLAGLWHGLANPYELAKARWHQAEAILGSGEGRPARARARGPLEEAARVAVDLGARPLLREVRELAGRAMIRLPLLDGLEPATVDGAAAAAGNGRDGPALVAVGPGHSDSAHSDDARSSVVRGVVGDAATPRKDTFGLSHREREVLALMAEGRTNREIGERLFISQKTVGVHVGNILAKLRVSGRVEAAAVAIRLGMTEPAAAGTRHGR